MSALILKLIACVTMLLDHIGYQTGDNFLRSIGRIAFPIFLYLIYNGYRHTSNPLKYALRLGLFTLLSQVPFCLFCYGVVFRDQWNVYLTLLVSLLCVWSTDKLLRNKLLRWVCFLPAAAMFLLYYKGILHSDYGVKAAVMVMAFYVLDGKALWKRLLLIPAFLCAVYCQPLLGAALSLLRGQGLVFRLSSWEKQQIWSLLSLPVIFLYNGQKGKLPVSPLLNRVIQWVFYLFYPLHLLLLWLIPWN